MATADIVPTVAPPQEWKLEVAEGPNTGAVIPLRVGRYRFGHDANNDIVLADAGVAEAQAIIEIDQNQRVTVRALAAGLIIGGRAIRPGRELTLRAGCDLAAGNTHLRIHGPDAPRARKRPLVAAGIAASGVFIGLMVLVLSPHNPSPASFPTGGLRSLDVGAARGRAALKAFEARLAALGLATRLTLSTTGNAVLVRGRLDAADMAVWQKAQHWYDATYGSVPALIAQVLPATLSPPDFGISAVSTDDVPYVITTSGQRYTEGSVLASGWVITHIDAHEITLTRDGQTVHVGL